MTHPDVEKVLVELDSHREKFESFCRALGNNELALTVPNSTWLVRDFIAHLATIDGPVMRMFENVHSGSGRGFKGEDGRGINIDTWNEEQVIPRREFSLDAVLREAEVSRNAIRNVMRTFTDSDLAYEFRFGGDSKRPPSRVTLGHYLRGWSKHDPMHVVDMLRGLPGSRNARSLGVDLRSDHRGLSEGHERLRRL
jgi:hypothetical protein